MVDNLKAGSVVVDLAAAAGGNCVATKKDEAIVTDAGVTVIGYTDLNSRLASTSSSLYANNQMKWLLSAGPTTTKVKGELALDHDDIAIRGEWSRLATRTRHAHAPLARATRCLCCCCSCWLALISHAGLNIGTSAGEPCRAMLAGPARRAGKASCGGRLC